MLSMQYPLFSLCYLLVINLMGFLLMGTDKQRAKKQQYRISEKTLFLVALLGGSLGTTAGMHLFRHKTKHWYFRIGMPTIFLLHLLFGIFLYIML